VKVVALAMLLEEEGEGGKKKYAVLYESEEREVRIRPVEGSAQVAELIEKLIRELEK